MLDNLTKKLGSQQARFAVVGGWGMFMLVVATILAVLAVRYEELLLGALALAEATVGASLTGRVCIVLGRECRQNDLARMTRLHDSRAAPFPWVRFALGSFSLAVACACAYLMAVSFTRGAWYPFAVFSLVFVLDAAAGAVTLAAAYTRLQYRLKCATCMCWLVDPCPWCLNTCTCTCHDDTSAAEVFP